MIYFIRFMNKYELTVVLPEGTTSAKQKSVKEKIEKLVETFKGKVSKVKDWGEISLAYKIKSNKKGVFVFFELDVEPEDAKNIGDKLRLDDEIVRYLLIRK
jgi:small subunit ribosomal protein S6